MYKKDKQIERDYNNIITEEKQTTKIMVMKFFDCNMDFTTYRIKITIPRFQPKSVLFVISSYYPYTI